MMKDQILEIPVTYYDKEYLNAITPVLTHVGRLLTNESLLLTIERNGFRDYFVLVDEIRINARVFIRKGDVKAS